MSSCRFAPTGNHGYCFQTSAPPGGRRRAYSRRFSTMHLKPYPKVHKKVIQLETRSDHTLPPCTRRTLAPLSTNVPRPSDESQPGTCTSPEQDGPLDIWSVIRPGNTMEKIALFASRCGLAKTKSCWEEEEGSIAKRRRLSLNRYVKWSKGVEPQAEEGEESKTPSVVEMVAYLEQQISGAKVDNSKPALSCRETESRGEEGRSEFVRVRDMVAQLESECLKQPCEWEAGGLSRSSSLRRRVRRVLLADSSPLVDQVNKDTTAESPQGEAQWEQCDTGIRLCQEPLPGLLFFSSTPEIPTQPIEDNQQAQKEEEEVEEEGVVNAERSLSPLHRQVSHEFLATRFKIQLLLEPQRYMAFLPHHLMVKIFSLLDTRTLAALKCTCRYFRFLIETYAVRPADALWVFDPRYKNDPCKQCKKRYHRGDVSLCRWHHKPYYQTLPYGPGYWMCCHGAHRDTPGCNVGLHDNRWVPAFHINVPLYRARDPDEDL